MTAFAQSISTELRFELLVGLRAPSLDLVPVLAQVLVPVLEGTTASWSQDPPEHTLPS